MPTIRMPSASDDHDALNDLFETTQYLPPAEPFELDEHGLPILDAEPDDPDDE